MFDEVLRPRHTSSRLHGDDNKKAIQVEIHVTLSPKQIKASILLNKLRLIGIFDLILELKRFVFDKLPEEDGTIIHVNSAFIHPSLNLHLSVYLYISPPPTDSFDEMDAPHIASSLLQQQLASYRVPPGHREEKKPPRDVLVKLSMTETDFVVVEDTRQLSSNAVVLKVSSVCVCVCHLWLRPTIWNLNSTVVIVHVPTVPCVNSIYYSPHPPIHTLSRP